MRLSTCVFARHLAVPRAAAKPLWALMTAALLAGCASQSEYDQGSWYGASQYAMEADGMPAQIPPLRRTKMEQVDPTEPFSPNYGPPTSPVQEEMEPKPMAPAQLERGSRQWIASAS